MKIKKIYIDIKNLDDSLKEAGEVFEQASRGKKVKQKTAVYFSNLREMRRVLTEKRLELLKTVKEKEPTSVYRSCKNSAQRLEECSAGYGIPSGTRYHRGNRYRGQKNSSVSLR